MQEKIKNLPWKIVVILGLIALIRPALKTIGSFAGFEVTSTVTLIITAAVAVIWVGVVVAKRLREPVLTLAAAGAVYALVSIFSAVVIQTIFPDSSDEASIPVLLTAGLVGSVMFNVLWGGLLGCVAYLVLKVTKRAR